MFTLRSLRGALIGLLFTSPAIAGDANRWSGIYLGGQVGGAFGNVDYKYINVPAEIGNRDPRGVMAGILAGVQVQFDHFVLGGELSVQGDGWSKVDDVGPDTPSFAAAFNFASRIQNLLTLGPRLGWAFNDQFMAYGEGGFARASVETGYFARAVPTNRDFRSNRFEGWFIGGGLDYSITRNMIIGINYKHIELDTELQGPVPPLVNVSRFVTPDVDVVSARITFKLTPDPIQ